MGNIQEYLELRNRFISIEGGEGSGKSSSINYIKEFYENKGYNVMITREPGGLSHLEELRGTMLNNEFETKSQMYLFGVTRLEHLTKKILPFLKENENNIVICDRYIDSSLVYQGIVGELGLDYVYDFNFSLVDGFLPFKTIYLSVLPEIGLKRIFTDDDREKNVYDKKPLDYHNEIKTAYDSLLNSVYDKGRIVEINANVSLEDVFVQLERVLNMV